MNNRKQSLLEDDKFLTLKYHFCECAFLQIIFGNNVTDPVDQNSLNAMVDYWISTTSTRKEFEMPKRKHSSAWRQREYEIEICLW